MSANGSRWPNGCRAAVTITMDNMGEAAELLRGTWPADNPVGRHYSVTDVLPRMLELLEMFDVRATYFIEGWNTGIYPDAIRAVQAAGHEVAFHGWQHEPWSQLDPETERALISRSVEGFRTLGHEVKGFRPPGGILTPLTPHYLRDFGFSYCSPAGTDAALDNGIVYLPFAWQGIDAYYYSESFSGLRAAKGDEANTISPTAFVERAIQLVEQCRENGRFTALLFHPFLETEPERIAAMERILEFINDRDDIWCAPGRDVARWVCEHPEYFGHEPQLDVTTWSR